MIAWEKISSDEGYRTTREMFEKLYLEPPNGKGFSIQRLAERFGCSVHAIREVLHKNGIAIRPRGGAAGPAKDHELSKVTEAEFHENGARHYAKLYNLDVTTVYKHFKRRGIRPKNEPEQPTSTEVTPSSPPSTGDTEDRG